MAAGFLSKPGSDYGPCATLEDGHECTHIDCVATRGIAGTKCRICAEPIGYDRRFYNDPHDGLVHEVCLSNEIEAELAATRESRRVVA